jgi:predicted ArsR family transcriptional regulator
MEGLTITEIAEILRITPQAAKFRLYRAGIIPVTKEALYDPSCVDQIRKISKGGRPRKEKPE